VQAAHEALPRARREQGSRRRADGLSHPRREARPRRRAPPLSPEQGGALQVETEPDPQPARLTLARIDAAAGGVTRRIEARKRPHRVSPNSGFAKLARASLLDPFGRGLVLAPGHLRKTSPPRARLRKRFEARARCATSRRSMRQKTPRRVARTVDKPSIRTSRRRRSLAAGRARG